MDDERKEEERGEEAQEQEARNPLRVLRNAPNLSGEKSCPSCGRTVAKDAVLCLFCGYNFSTGMRVAPAKAKKSYGGVIALVVLLAAIGGGIWYWQELQHAAGKVQEMASETAHKAAEKVEDGSRAVSEMINKRRAEEEAAAAAAQEQARWQFQEKFDESQPLWTEGEEVVLRRQNGIVTRGKLQKSEYRNGVCFAVLERADGTQEEIKATELDAASRLRLDAEYRERIFEKKSESAEQKLRRKFDETEPLWREGDTVVLRKRNGVVTRGTFAGLENRGEEKYAMVDGEGGERSAVKVADLDVASRRRLDEEFREAYFKRYLYRKLGGGSETGTGL